MGIGDRGMTMSGGMGMGKGYVYGVRGIGMGYP